FGLCRGGPRNSSAQSRRGARPVVLFVRCIIPSCGLSRSVLFRPPCTLDVPLRLIVHPEREFHPTTRVALSGEEAESGPTARRPRCGGGEGGLRSIIRPGPAERTARRLTSRRRIRAHSSIGAAIVAYDPPAPPGTETGLGLRGADRTRGGGSVSTVQAE